MFRFTALSGFSTSFHFVFTSSSLRLHFDYTSLQVARVFPRGSFPQHGPANRRLSKSGSTWGPGTVSLSMSHLLATFMRSLDNLALLVFLLVHSFLCLVVVVMVSANGCGELVLWPPWLVPLVCQEHHGLANSKQRIRHWHLPTVPVVQILGDVLSWLHTCSEGFQDISCQLDWDGASTAAHATNPQFKIRFSKLRLGNFVVVW